MKRTCITFLCATITFGAATVASNAVADVNGLYVGGNYGWSRSAYGTGFIDDRFQSEANYSGDVLQLDSSSAHRSASAWWAEAGYWSGAYFGIEAAFLHLGELTYRAAETFKTSTGGEPIAAVASVSSRGPAISLVGRLPLTDVLEVDLRAGDYYGRTTLTTGLDFDSTSGSSTQSTTTSSLLVGAGAGYTLDEHWTLRLDYLRIVQAGDRRVGRFDADLVTAGVSLTF